MTAVSRATWNDYLQQVLALRVHNDVGAKAMYTAMHGVGWPHDSRCLRKCRAPQTHRGPEQRDPDGDFPTVAFPNPEEPGALDLALNLAAEHDADLIIANDPDADRLAVAVRGHSGWRMLTGNQWIVAGRRFALQWSASGQRMVSIPLSPHLSWAISPMLIKPYTWKP